MIEIKNACKRKQAAFISWKRVRKERLNFKGEIELWYLEGEYLQKTNRDPNTAVWFCQTRIWMRLLLRHAPVDAGGLL